MIDYVFGIFFYMDGIKFKNEILYYYDLMMSFGLWWLMIDLFIDSWILIRFGDIRMSLWYIMIWLIRFYV